MAETNQSDNSSGSAWMLVVPFLPFLFTIVIAVSLLAFGAGANAGPNPRGAQAPQVIEVGPDSPVKDLLAEFQRNANSSQYLLENTSALDSQLSPLFAKVEELYGPTGQFKDHPKASEALGIVKTMREQVQLIIANITSNREFARQKSLNFIASKQRLASILQTSSSGIFPVDLSKNPEYQNGWLDDRGDHKHAGIDIMVPRGTDVIAVAEGVIEKAGYGDGWGGQKLTLKADDSNLKYYYAHIINMRVRNGDRVTRGQVIAQSGVANNTPHLHFGIKAPEGTPDSYRYSGNYWINPYPFLLELDPRR